MTADNLHSLSDADIQAQAHDALCRLAALSASCPRHWCRLRRCRRAGICLGDLRPADGAPALLLPPCIADLDAPPTQDFLAGLRHWAGELDGRGMAAFDSPRRDP